MFLANRSNFVTIKVSPSFNFLNTRLNCGRSTVVPVNFSWKTSSAPAAEISNYYQKRIGVMDGQQYQILTDYLTLDGMELEVIKTAIDKAADNSKRSFSYINSILKNWRQNGIRTMVQVEDEQRQFQQKKQGQSDDDIQDPFIY